MGRDWAPFESYLSEQRQIKEGYGSFWDMVKSSEICLAGKEPVRMYSDEEIALRRNFPFIGRFLFDDFPKLYGYLSAIEGGIDLLHAKDLELASFLEASKVTESGPNNFVLKVDDIGVDMNSYLMKWFAGKLDENFYYSERNNQLFIEEMVKEALVKALENAVAIEYKGVLFDEWTVDATGNMKGIWGEMCQCCAEQHKEVLSEELREGGVGACSVNGCNIVGDLCDTEEHYYIDFKPELIKPLSLEELLKKQFGEILEYDTKAKEQFEDIVDVMTPQECADLYGKPVRFGDEIFLPEEKRKFNVVITTLDDELNEQENIIKKCMSREEAEEYVVAHEQDFADDGSIYAVYIEEDTEVKPALEEKINEAAEQKACNVHLEDLVDLDAQHKQNSEATRKVMDFITDDER